METLHGLTDRQREKPHSIVHYAGHRGISVLERSFARGGLEEIEYWDTKGVLDDALSGKTKSKRDYTATLFQHLLEGRRQGFWSHDADRWDAILRKLWDGGAHRHTDKHARWIHGLGGHWLFDVMLDAGVSPYGTSVYKEDAVGSMLNAIASHEASVAEGRGRWFAAAVFDPDLIRQQIDRSLDFPIASPAALSDVLARVVNRGIARQNQEPWRRWRDKLLERGANPLQSHAFAIACLGFAGPGHEPIARYELVRLDRDIDMGQPPTDAEIRLSLAERAKRDQQWVEASTEWLDALAPSIRMHAAKDPHHKLEASIWARLLDQPNGVDLCRRLINAGANPPWPDQDPSLSSADILSSGHRREVDRLSRVVELIDTHGSTMSPVWAENMLVNYSRQRMANDVRLQPKFDDRVHDYSRGKRGPSRFQPQDFEALSHEEITHLLKLVHWSPGKEVSPRFSEILARRPFLPGPAGIAADIDFLVGNGLLKQALAPSAEKATDLHRVDWVRYVPWFDGWMGNDAVFTKVIATDPHLHWPLLALAVQMAARNQSSPEIRHKWFARLAKDFPQNAEPVLTHIFASLVTAPDMWIRDKRETAGVDLLAFGGRATTEQLAELASKVFNLAGSAAPERQVDIIRFLADVGVDLKTQGPALIEIELLRELSIDQSPTRTDMYKPAIMAILEGGADVSLLDLGRSSRPLHEFVRITASSLALKAETPVNTVASRSRRF